MIVFALFENTNYGANVEVMIKMDSEDYYPNRPFAYYAEAAKRDFTTTFCDYADKFGFELIGFYTERTCHIKDEHKPWNDPQFNRVKKGRWDLPIHDAGDDYETKFVEGVEHQHDQPAPSGIVYRYGWWCTECNNPHVHCTCEVR